MNQSIDILNTMESWVGYSENNGKFKEIIDIYNTITPLPRGYRVKYTDEWCATTVSAAFKKNDMIDLIFGGECSCSRFLELFKKNGIWLENGSITPEEGYICLYNWNTSEQPNTGSPDHIGIVKSVIGNTIHVIEGNKSESVQIRKIPIGWGYIRGYGVPKYDMSVVKAKEIIKNKVGLEDGTIEYLQNYLYGNDLIIKLANALK